jgi:two-component system, NtrC family, sensor histidine kinase GlrK
MGSPVSTSAWRIRTWLPRSMAGLIVAGYLLASTPLLAAVIMAGLVLERLSAHSEILIEEGVALERLGMGLQNRIDNLERAARQYGVLGDPALLELFSERIQEALSILKEIEGRGSGVPLHEHLRVVDEGLETVTRTWTNAPGSEASLVEIVSRLRSLRKEAEAITASGGGALDAQVEELRRASMTARSVILLSAVALVPLTALLALALSIAVTRPLQKMGRAVAALGHSHYERTIVIEYPREMRHLAERLDWLRRRLAQLETEKERFLRHVSHELKTPLASLREGADLLLRGFLGPLSPQQLEVAHILAESTSGLDLQIRRLLAFAKWREGHRQAEATWFEAGHLIEAVLRTHKPSMMKRSLTANVVVESARLFGLRSQLRVALENLVANAIRHGPRGTTIEIHATIRHGRCELWVRDHGSGIPDPTKRRIFEPYVRGDGGDEHGIRGSGLGLSIVEEIVLAHGGVVEVEDAHPGTRFKLVWPSPRGSEAGHTAQRRVDDASVRTHAVLARDSARGGPERLPDDSSGLSGARDQRERDRAGDALD